MITTFSNFIRFFLFRLWMEDNTKVFSFLVGNQIEVSGNVIFSNEEAADSGMNARDRLGESDTVNNVQF